MLPSLLLCGGLCSHGWPGSWGCGHDIPPGADGFFEQFGRCTACPASAGASVGTFIGLVFVLVVLGCAAFAIRKVLPVDVLKLGLSMLQVCTQCRSGKADPNRRSTFSCARFHRLVLVR